MMKIIDIDSLLRFIFPETCHICGNKLSKGNRYICPSCLMDLPRSLFHRLPDNPMEQRFTGHFKFVRATAHFIYASGTPISKLMQDLKYRHFMGLGKMLGEIVAKELYTTGFFNGIDYIVPIPMHFIKKANRGYNQAEIIAQGISEISGIPQRNLLRARKRHKTQTKQTLEMRRRNLKGIFKIKSAVDLNNVHILLIDDVCTTGSTITEAATTILSSYPCSRISILAVAATH